MESYEGTAPLDRWEHLIVTLAASAPHQEHFLARRWPDRQFPKYAPEALIPELDVYGADGWELVALQPVILGDNGDVLIAGAPTLGERYTRQYLCTLKRRRTEW